MNFSLVLPLLCIFAADILFYTTIKSNKLEFEGKNEYRFIIPVVVLLFIVSLFVGKEFNFENVLISIGLIIFMLLGNKCGVGNKGIITGSWFTGWSKIDNVYVEMQGEKCILFYSNKNVKRRLIFKKEDENELRKYIDNIKNEKGIK